MNSRSPESAPRPRRLGAGVPFAWLLLLGLAGCGDGNNAARPYSGPVYPVKGSVLLASGKPLTSGKVIFLPKAPEGSSASGEIGSEGTFTLKTPDGKEGAAPGEYKVRIEPGATLVKAGKGGVGLDPKSIPFPQQYTDEDGDTGLTATVKAESTQLEPLMLIEPKQAKKQERSRD